MIAEGNHPEFDVELEYGKATERWLDHLAKHGRVETKHKRREDDGIYVELEHDPGRTGTYRPSGLSTTKADAWLYQIGDTGIAYVITVDTLRDAVDKRIGRPAERTIGSCPTRGFLIWIETLVFWWRRQTELCGECGAPLAAGQQTGQHHSCRAGRVTDGSLL